MKLVRDGPMMLLVGAGCLLFGIGAFLEYVYCEWRRDTEVQQLTQIAHQGLAIGQTCIGTLGEVVPGAFVAALQHPIAARAIVVPVSRRDSVTRDSLRERRWVTP